MEAQRSPIHNGTWWCFAWMVLATAALGFGLGGHALIDPDEGRNASIAEAMAVSGDFLLPHLNGLPFLDKPFLFFATSATSIRLFGTSELAARLPALLFAWATVILTAWFGGRLFGRRAAAVAGIACATAPLHVAFSKIVIFDSMLSFFVVLALVSFYCAMDSLPVGSLPVGSLPVESQQTTRKDYRLWTVLAWLAMAMGMLTKGPVALLVPLLVAVPFAIWRRASQAVWHPAGWLLYLAIVLPWVWAVEERVPGFVHYALVTETWQRLTSDELKRTGPVWYFLPYLLGGAFPWSLVVLAAFRRRWRETWEGRLGAPLVFLLLWIGIPLLFFSLSQSKRPQYILSLMPAIALLAAWSLSGEKTSVRAARAGALGWLLLGCALLVAVSGLLPISYGANEELATTIHSTAWLLAVLTLGAGLMAWLGARRREVALVALSLPVVLLHLAVAPLVQQISHQRSAIALAAALAPHVESQVVGVEVFLPSLEFYRERPMIVSSSTGKPLGSRRGGDGGGIYPPQHAGYPVVHAGGERIHALGFYPGAR